MSPPIAVLARRAAVLVWVAGVSTACQSRFGPNDIVFQDAMRRWRDAGVRDYSMVITQMLHSGTPRAAARVTVRDAVVVDRRDTTSGEPVPASEAAQYPDVPGLFQLLDEAFGNASAVQAAYDNTYGFPSLVFIEYSFSDPSNFVRLAVSEFTVGSAATPRRLAEDAVP